MKASSLVSFSWSSGNRSAISGSGSGSTIRSISKPASVKLVTHACERKPPVSDVPSTVVPILLDRLDREVAPAEAQPVGRRVECGHDQPSARLQNPMDLSEGGDRSSR